jgi:hypothetical protein
MALYFMKEPALTIAFLDIEASGLGSQSWPVEIGWAVGAAAPVSMLVRPHPTWPADAWDPRAEALHGISLAQLNRDGADPRDAAERLNRELDGAEVFSDAPDWDGFWLFRLFGAAGLRQRFSVQDFARLMRSLGVADGAALLDQANRISPRRHRAAPDVQHLQTIHRLAQGAAVDR